MPSFNAVVLLSDPRVAQSLVASMGHAFHSVRSVRSLSELRSNIAKNRAEVVVLDMELASLSDLERLSAEFPGVSIVCTHRLADETMWTTALGAGAADICPSDDTKSILMAAIRTVTATRGAVA
jgi:DNA-binding NarL/FixJ family response regulator